MSQSGPTPESTQFIAFLDALIKANHSALQLDKSNVMRVIFLRSILKDHKIPRNAISLMFKALRKNGFTDKTQPIIDLLEKIKEDKNFTSLTKNSNRADYLEGRLASTPHGDDFSKQEIMHILQNEGYEDQYNFNDYVNFYVIQPIFKYFEGFKNILSKIDPINNPQETTLILLILLHLLNLIMIPFNVYNVFFYLKHAPGYFARHFTMGLTTNTLKQSMSKDNRLQMGVAFAETSLSIAIWSQYLPSLAMVFQYFPEMLDPKTYGDKAVNALEETFGQHMFYVLTPIVILMSKYGPGAIHALFHKMANSAPMQAAHEFCTLMRGGEDADALLQANPELNDSFVVHGGLNWLYKKSEHNQLTTTSTPAAATEDVRLAAAFSPD